MNLRDLTDEEMEELERRVGFMLLRLPPLARHAGHERPLSTLLDYVQAADGDSKVVRASIEFLHDLLSGMSTDELLQQVVRQSRDLRVQRDQGPHQVSRARHCGGFRTVTLPDGRVTMEEVNGRACRSREGLCACLCSGCVAARGCKHERTMVDMWTMTPLFPGMRMDFGHGRAKRADGTDYVGPTMTVRPARPDEPELKPESGTSETCMDCGMRIRGRVSEVDSSTPP